MSKQGKSAKKTTPKKKAEPKDRSKELTLDQLEKVSGGRDQASGLAVGKRH